MGEERSLQSRCYSNVHLYSLVCGEYDKCSRISNMFLVPFSNKILVIRAGIHKMIVRIANREDPDQTASSEAV